MKTPSTKTTVEPTTPEWGTPEFKVWWESQYDYAESHNVKRCSIQDLEVQALLNGADFRGK